MIFENEQDPLYNYWSNIINKLEQIKSEDNLDEIQNLKDDILENIGKLVDGYSQKLQREKVSQEQTQVSLGDSQPVQTAEIEKEALTVQSLRMLSEIYDGCSNAFMDRETFIDTYLDGIGKYEKKIAKKHKIQIR